MNQIIATYLVEMEQIGNQQFRQTIKILLFNKLERVAKTYAQVMAIERVEKRIPNFQGLNHFLIFQEFQQQQRFLEQFQKQYINTDKQGEFEEAKYEYYKMYIILQQMLSKENQMFIESINSQIQYVNNQPKYDLLELLNKYHFKSQLDFHNLLKNDPKGQELQQCMRDYSQKLSEYLYFLFIKEEDPNLKLLFNLILINKTQNNEKILDILNNYIKSLINEEKQNVIHYLNLIMSVFIDLSDYFNNIIKVINDQTQLDGKLQLNQKQFEIILLILDISNRDRINQCLLFSQDSCDILRQILWIYKDDCSQQLLISQQKYLTNHLSKILDEKIIYELIQVLETLQSIKLKLLIERIIEFYQKKEKELNLEFLEFKIFLPQDQEQLNRYVQSLAISENQQQYEIYQEQEQEQGAQKPKIKFATKIQISKFIFSFLNILSFAGDIDQKKIDSNEELQKLISEEVENFGTLYDPNLFATRFKIRQALIYFLQLQKLQLSTFKELWLLAEQLRLYLEKVEQFILRHTLGKQFFPSMNSILSTYRCRSNESIEFIMLKNQILKDLFKSTNDCYYNDFYQMMTLIEQYNSKNEQNFLQEVMQYYKRDFKQHLDKLQAKGSNEVKTAIESIFKITQ